jgi:hypothetical protein
MRDDVAHAAHHLPEIKRDIRRNKTHLSRMPGIAQRFGRPDQSLAGNTSGPKALAPEALSLHQRDAGTEQGGAGSGD